MKLKIMSKSRLSDLLVERGLASSIQRAEALVLAGQVWIDGQRAAGAGMPVSDDCQLELRGAGEKNVGRGALKLEGAISRFGLNLSGRICADVGSSTGGFTEVMLKQGAARIFAIDVGYGELAWKLRQDSRVVVMERTNARYLESLPEAVSFVSADVSFISLKLILPQVKKWLCQPAGEADIVVLIKPQFEAKREQVEKGGIVRDPQVHREVLEDILGWCAANQLITAGLMRSPIEGMQGNIEFLAWLKAGFQGGIDVARAIEEL